MPIKEIRGRAGLWPIRRHLMENEPLHRMSKNRVIVTPSQWPGQLMNRLHFLSSIRPRALTAAMFAVALTLPGCGGDPSAKDLERLDSKELSAEERMVAEALIAGFRHETGAASLGDAEIERAVCYAKSVEMPEAYADVHKLYLADYASIDQDFYPWFQGEGVSMEDAWDIADRVKKAFDACAVQ